MANWGYLLGGAVVGAAGLYTVVNKISQKDEEQNPLRFYVAPQCLLDADSVSKLDVSEVIEQLSNFENAASKLHMKCSLICKESIAYQDAPFDTMVNGLWDRLKNTLCGHMAETGRPWMLDSLVKVRKNLARLYLSYHPVFLRANALLQETRTQTVSLKGMTLKDVTLKMDHSLFNETWGADFEKQADKLRDFADRTISAATALRERLKLKSQCNPENLPNAESTPNTGV